MVNIPPTGPRFTLYGGDELEKRIAADIAYVTDTIRHAVPESVLVAIWLGGGYGRGEGGIRKTVVGELPYNDYDFFVIVHKLACFRMAGLKRTLNRLAADCGLELGVEVEIALLTVTQLEHLECQQIWVDLRSSARTVWGDDSVVAKLPAYPPATIPPFEGTRLLINRTALLLMVAYPRYAPGGRLTEEQATRWVRKTILACGDALLITTGNYRTGWLDRLQVVLADPEMDTWLKDHYRDAVYERLRGDDGLAPSHPSPTADDFFGYVLDVYLRVESIRLGRDWRADSISDYVDYVMQNERSRCTMARLCAALPAILAGPRAWGTAQDVLYYAHDPVEMFLALWTARK